MLTLLVILLALILLVLFGVLVVGVLLKLLWWALVGLVVGGLARLVLRERATVSWLATVALGVVGALLGGIVGDALGGNWLLELLLAIAIAAGLMVWWGGRDRRAYA